MDEVREARKTACCTGQDMRIWGVFLVLIAALWALALAGVIPSDFWKFVGVLGVLFAGISMLWRR